MELIRENKEKQRATYFCGDRYRKVWGNTTPKWISEHVQLLKQHVPGYVLDFGDNWIDYKIIPGIPANTFEHTPEFVNRIYTFCIENIKQTMPYTHGDWSLSNIIVDGNTLTMCDWDNLGKYHIDDVFEKLNEDLSSAFGDRFHFIANHSGN
jgi:RIO-like serine/threonine protein kinase